MQVGVVVTDLLTTGIGKIAVAKSVTMLKPELKNLPIKHQVSEVATSSKYDYCVPNVKPWKTPSRNLLVPELCNRPAYKDRLEARPQSEKLSYASALRSC